MRCRQILGMIVLLLSVFVAVNPNVVSARSAVLSLDIPLTPREQAARLSRLASPDVARKLYPSAVETAKPPRPLPYYQRDYRLAWINAPEHRTKLAEKIGEQGRARYAAEHGLTKLLGSRNRGIRQGPDSVYWNSRSGRLLVLESKGGTARLKTHYGLQQGTNQSTLQSAKNVLTTYSKSASRNMKVQAARVILAAKRGQLDTGVVRTPHVLGKPNAPELVRPPDSTDVAREARRAIREIEKSPEMRDIFREAKRNHLQDRLKYRATQGLTVIGFASALGLGWDAYQQSRAAWSMFDDPTLKGSVLPYMQTGMAFGRAAQATTLGVGSAAQREILKLSAKRGAGWVAGRAFLPVALGVEGLQLATAYHEYGLGRISQREFYRRSAGPAIMAVFTVGGSTVGGIIGFQAGGAGAIPGAMAGATIGAVAAIPIQFATDYMVGWYYREFDEQQRRVVNSAVETFYGIETHDQVVEH